MSNNNDHRSLAHNNDDGNVSDSGLHHEPPSSLSALSRDVDRGRSGSNHNLPDPDEGYDLIEELPSTSSGGSSGSPVTRQRPHPPPPSPPPPPVPGARSSLVPPSRQELDDEENIDPLQNVAVDQRPPSGAGGAAAVADVPNDLSVDKIIKLEQFQAFTGEVDQSKSRQMLEDCNWDVQLALNHSFETQEAQYGGGGGGGNAADPARPGSSLGTDRPRIIGPHPEDLLANEVRQRAAAAGIGQQHPVIHHSASSQPLFPVIDPLPLQNVNNHNHQSQNNMNNNINNNARGESVLRSVRRLVRRHIDDDEHEHELGHDHDDEDGPDLEDEDSDPEGNLRPGRGPGPGPGHGPGAGPVSLFSLSGLIQVAFAPFYFLYDSVMSLIRFAWSFIATDPRRNLVDPVADVLTFIQAFEDKYGTQHPTFFPGAYSQAIAEAKRELRFLLAYLHDDQATSPLSVRVTDEFVRRILISPEFMQLLSRHNVLLWGCSVNLPEGYRVSQTFHERAHPFLALIVLKEGRMTIVGRWESPAVTLNPGRLRDSLEMVLSANETHLVAARLEREELSMNQILRQEQDAAYLASLAADQEKERRRAAAERERMAAVEALRRQEEADRSALEHLQRLRDELGDHIPPEPENGNASDPDPDHGLGQAIVKLLIKLPDGTRLERRFHRRQSIAYLYYYVFTHPAAPFRFLITSNFPRRDLPGEPPNAAWRSATDLHAEAAKWPTFDSVGLSQSEMLFVRDLEA